jgi:hypothetical protein
MHEYRLKQAGSPYAEDTPSPQQPNILTEGRLALIINYLCDGLIDKKIKTQTPSKRSQDINVLDFNEY